MGDRDQERDPIIPVPVHPSFKKELKRSDTCDDDDLFTVNINIEELRDKGESICYDKFDSLPELNPQPDYQISSEQQFMTLEPGRPPIKPGHPQDFAPKLELGSGVRPVLSQYPKQSMEVNIWVKDWQDAVNLPAVDSKQQRLRKYRLRQVLQRFINEVVPTAVSIISVQTVAGTGTGGVQTDILSSPTTDDDQFISEQLPHSAIISDVMYFFSHSKSNIEKCGSPESAEKLTHHMQKGTDAVVRCAEPQVGQYPYITLSYLGYTVFIRPVTSTLKQPQHNPEDPMATYISARCADKMNIKGHWTPLNLHRRDQQNTDVRKFTYGPADVIVKRSTRDGLYYYESGNDRLMPAMSPNTEFHRQGYLYQRLRREAVINNKNRKGLRTPISSDVFSNFGSNRSEEHETEAALCTDVILTGQVPHLLDDLLTECWSARLSDAPPPTVADYLSTGRPSGGKTRLSRYFHSRGVNMRFLGLVLQLTIERLQKIMLASLQPFEYKKIVDEDKNINVPASVFAAHTREIILTLRTEMVSRVLKNIIKDSMRRGGHSLIQIVEFVFGDTEDSEEQLDQKMQFWFELVVPRLESKFGSGQQAQLQPFTVDDTDKTILFRRVSELTGLVLGRSSSGSACCLLRNKQRFTCDLSLCNVIPILTLPVIPPVVYKEGEKANLTRRALQLVRAVVESDLSSTADPNKIFLQIKNRCDTASEYLEMTQGNEIDNSVVTWKATRQSMTLCHSDQLNDSGRAKDDSEYQTVVYPRNQGGHVQFVVDGSHPDFNKFGRDLRPYQEVLMTTRRYENQRAVIVGVRKGWLWRHTYGDVGASPFNAVNEIELQERYGLIVERENVKLPAAGLINTVVERSDPSRSHVTTRQSYVGESDPYFIDWLQGSGGITSFDASETSLFPTGLCHGDLVFSEMSGILSIIIGIHPSSKQVWSLNTNSGLTFEMVSGQRNNSDIVTKYQLVTVGKRKLAPIHDTVLIEFRGDQFDISRKTCGKFGIYYRQTVLLCNGEYSGTSATVLGVNRGDMCLLITCEGDVNDDQVIHCAGCIDAHDLSLEYAPHVIRYNPEYLIKPQIIDSYRTMEFKTWQGHTKKFIIQSSILYEKFRVLHGHKVRVKSGRWLHRIFIVVGISADPVDEVALWAILSGELEYYGGAVPLVNCDIEIMGLHIGDLTCDTQQPTTVISEINTKKNIKTKWAKLPTLRNPVKRLSFAGLMQTIDMNGIHQPVEHLTFFGEIITFEASHNVLCALGVYFNQRVLYQPPHCGNSFFAAIVGFWRGEIWIRPDNKLYAIPITGDNEIDIRKQITVVGITSVKQKPLKDLLIPEVDSTTGLLINYKQIVSKSIDRSYCNPLIDKSVISHCTSSFELVGLLTDLDSLGIYGNGYQTGQRLCIAGGYHNTATRTKAADGCGIDVYYKWFNTSDIVTVLGVLGTQLFVQKDDQFGSTSLAIPTQGVQSLQSIVGCGDLTTVKKNCFLTETDRLAQLRRIREVEDSTDGLPRVASPKADRSEAITEMSEDMLKPYIRLVTREELIEIGKKFEIFPCARLRAILEEVLKTHGLGLRYSESEVDAFKKLSVLTKIFDVCLSIPTIMNSQMFSKNSSKADIDHSYEEVVSRRENMLHSRNTAFKEDVEEDRLYRLKIDKEIRDVSIMRAEESNDQGRLRQLRKPRNSLRSIAGRLEWIAEEQEIQQKKLQKLAARKSAAELNLPFSRSLLTETDTTPQPPNLVDSVLYYDTDFQYLRANAQVIYFDTREVSTSKWKLPAGSRVTYGRGDLSGVTAVVLGSHEGKLWMYDEDDSGGAATPLSALTAQEAYDDHKLTITERNVKVRNADPFIYTLWDSRVVEIDISIPACDVFSVYHGERYSCGTDPPLLGDVPRWWTGSRPFVITIIGVFKKQLYYSFNDQSGAVAFTGTNITEAFRLELLYTAPVIQKGRDELTSKDIVKYIGKYTADNRLPMFTGMLAASTAQRLARRFVGKVVTKTKPPEQQVQINRSVKWIPMMFDISSEVFERLDIKYRHGDRIVFPTQQVCDHRAGTVIGIARLQLWVHIDGDGGATPWSVPDLNVCSIVDKATVLVMVKERSSLKQNLLRYPTTACNIALFDSSSKGSAKFNLLPNDIITFLSGQTNHTAVVIGVRSGILWRHVNGEKGASPFLGVSSASDLEQFGVVVIGKKTHSGDVFF